MEESLFPEYVKKYWGPITGALSETINGTIEAPKYMFMSMLTEQFSPTLEWNSLMVKGTNVMADVVALDSSLPIVKRDAIEKASGEIPKLGMKLYLTERQLNNIRYIIARGGKEEQAVKMIFADIKKCTAGISETLEYMFLQALSSGVTLIDANTSKGTGIRVDFKVPTANKKKVVAVWSDATNATPLDDIEAVVNAAKAKGYVFSKMMMDLSTFNQMKKTAQVKERYSAAIGIADASKAPTPSLKNVNEFLMEDFGLMIEVVNRTTLFEKDGVQTAKTPWTAGAVVFLTSDKVGSLQYGTLAEEDGPVEGVVYSKPTAYTLLSKYHSNDPYREYTSSQAHVIPVLENVDSIFIMDSTTAA